MFKMLLGMAMLTVDLLTRPVGWNILVGFEVSILGSSIGAGYCEPKFSAGIGQVSPGCGLSQGRIHSSSLRTPFLGLCLMLRRAICRSWSFRTFLTFCRWRLLFFWSIFAIVTAGARELKLFVVGTRNLE